MRQSNSQRPAVRRERHRSEEIAVRMRSQALPQNPTAHLADLIIPARGAHEPFIIGAENDKLPHRLRECLHKNAASNIPNFERSKAANRDPIAVRTYCGGN